ncbi:MAG: tRNA (N6-isopentenyl adenosine(37)-C2)-methylthiotransferase MiaB [Treponema sp.]|nr:tRNA (N6-isopentenyl adenosine(37)-C2)-methylthiotransferase MiaB [Treponema sp.]MBQ2601141.1 tRNA (N6-isopentenyl adenosine(37)-C2)-methylthiotransferase MiaB [Treponema sp.]
MTYFFETYGCEMNRAESASLEQLLISRGWTSAECPEVADMVIINTCSVRASAETRIYGRLGFYSGLKKIRNCEKDAKVRSLEKAAEYVKDGPVPLTVVVMGCMAERLLATFKKDWPVIDYVVGTYAKNSFGDIIQAVEDGRDPVEVVEAPAYTFAESSYEQGAFSTFVPIMNGCNNFCTYCIVPHVRGREISRPVSDIIRELDVLSKRSVKEITLLGQNVNSYRDADGTDFPGLLKAILRHLDETSSPIHWIRFESPHPKDFSDALIDLIAAEPRICRGIHLPVQHGSTKVLREMNRRYTREDYLSLVSRLRAKVPDLALTTDIMLGFPGESEGDFEEAVSLMKEVRYNAAFMYYYNPREGTPAAKFKDQVPMEVKKERLQKIIDMQLAISSEVLEKRVGMTVEVLADIISRDNRNELLGKTSQNERVAFEAPQSLIGKFVKVRLDELSGNTFRGTLV